MTAILMLLLNICPSLNPVFISRIDAVYVHGYASLFTFVDSVTIS
jgi:hypothetical protein